ncbi:hypothetical protein GCM10009646_77820 [Streptomyces aureus]
MVWCDFGGVLSPPVDEAFARLASAAGVPVQDLAAAARAVAAAMGLDGVAAPLERGVLSQREWGRRVTAALAPRWHPLIDLGRFGDHFYTGRVLNTALLDHLTSLRECGVRLGLLTNSVKEWEPHRAAMFAAAGRSDAVFDAVLRSHEVGVAKPDEAMFALAEAVFGTPPGQCVLIDDVTDNCEAARRRGWTALPHTTTEQTVAAVGRLLPVPAAGPGSLERKRYILRPRQGRPRS